jgi:hypothetical protein
VDLPKNGGSWRIGTNADVAWIVGNTPPGRTIGSAIPPVYAAYATIIVPDPGAERSTHHHAVLALLAEQSPGPWWLGYLESGDTDVVFPEAPRVPLYTGWNYVLVEAGPDQAAAWRNEDTGSGWRGWLPELIFPADRSWLFSTLWDDDWTCLGGPAALVDRFLRHPDLSARTVTPDEDATPPGRTAL